MPLIFLLIFVIIKQIGLTLVYNLFFIPFLIYIFISKKSDFLNKDLSIYAFLLLSVLNFGSFYFNDRSGSEISYLILRSLNLTIFYMSLFGLLPFNKQLFSFLKYLVFFSIPAIFFLIDPPIIYSNMSMGVENPRVFGLFGGIGLTGLFPSSIYFSQFIVAYVLYLNYFSNNKEYISFSFSKNILFDRVLSIVLLMFTNRKAFLFPLIFFTLKELFSSARNIIIFNRIKKLSIGLIGLSFIMVLAFYFLINTIHLSITPSDIFEDIYKRVSVYIEWAINPDKYSYYESAIMNINLTGGKFSYFLTLFFLVISFSFNLRNITKGGIFKILVAYSYISLFLFKESATLFSPSPSSLVLFMIVSAILGNNINNKFLQKYQFHN